MSPKDVHSTRRTVLKTVGGTAVGLTVAVGAAAADHEHPDVETVGVSDITTETATLHGEVTAFGDGADSVGAWFQWDLASDDGFSRSAGRQTLDSPDTYSAFLDNLNPDTQYKFRAVAEDNDDGDRGYGDTDFFTTQSEDEFLR